MRAELKICNNLSWLLYAILHSPQWQTISGQKVPMEVGPGCVTRIPEPSGNLRSAVRVVIKSFMGDERFFCIITKSLHQPLKAED